MPRTDPTDPAVHLLEVTRRFADMDVLGHVNNVRYLDYVTAGREALLTAYDVDPAGVTVRRHRVGFLAPMTFGRAPAQVRSWVVAVTGSEVRLAHEVVGRGHRGTDPATVHLRVETTLDLADRGALAEASYAAAPTWREVSASDRPPRDEQPVEVRARDLGPDGAARDDAVMEFFQESRVRYFMGLHTAGQEWGQVVVAHTDLDLLAPVRPGAGQRVRTWVAGLGTSSFVVRSELVGSGEVVLARADVVLVCFDASTQRPAPMAPAHRARLESELGAD